MLCPAPAQHLDKHPAGGHAEAACWTNDMSVQVIAVTKLGKGEAKVVLRKGNDGRQLLDVDGADRGKTAAEMGEKLDFTDVVGQSQSAQIGADRLVADRSWPEGQALHASFRRVGRPQRPGARGPFPAFLAAVDLSPGGLPGVDVTLADRAAGCRRAVFERLLGS